MTMRVSTASVKIHEKSSKPTDSYTDGRTKQLIKRGKLIPPMDTRAKKTLYRMKLVSCEELNQSDDNVEFKGNIIYFKVFM